MPIYSAGPQHCHFFLSSDSFCTSCRIIWGSSSGVYIWLLHVEDTKSIFSSSNDLCSVPIKLFVDNTIKILNWDSSLGYLNPTTATISASHLDRMSWTTFCFQATLQCILTTKWYLCWAQILVKYSICLYDVSIDASEYWTNSLVKYGNWFIICCDSTIKVFTWSLCPGFMQGQTLTIQDVFFSVLYLQAYCVLITNTGSNTVTCFPHWHCCNENNVIMVVVVFPYLSSQFQKPQHPRCWLSFVCSWNFCPTGQK